MISADNGGRAEHLDCSTVREEPKLFAEDVNGYNVNTCHAPQNTAYMAKWQRSNKCYMYCNEHRVWCTTPILLLYSSGKQGRILAWTRIWFVFLMRTYWYILHTDMYILLCFLLSLRKEQDSYWCPRKHSSSISMGVTYSQSTFYLWLICVPYQLIPRIVDSYW